MGFSKVFKTLQEVFPEVDSRILRAVSIEHCKDPDAAVEVVLNEVIPCLTQRNKPPSTSSGQSGVTSSGQSGVTVKSSEAVMDAKEASPQKEASLLDNAKESDELQDGLTFHEASCEHNKTVEDTDGDSLQHYHDAVGGDHVAFEGDEIGTAASKSSEVSTEKSCQVTFPTSNDVDIVGDDVHECASPEATSFKVTKSDEAVVALDQLRLPTDCVHSQNTLDGTDNSASDDSTALIHKRVHEEESLVDNQDMKHPESQLESSNVQTLTLSGSEISIELVAAPDVHDFELEKVEINYSLDATSDIDLASDMVVNEVESMPNPVVTASGQICSVDLLQDMITEAKNNKKTLFLAMESVIFLMREVELHEEAAQQVNQEAVKGGLDLLGKVEQLKEMLQHAKEANDMHAGEVHGEKAILATEVKELQSRLLGLADERDKSLAVLEEMRQTLELRMAAAEKELKAADQERQSKELLARKALADQELIMERVVQESNILKQEAEENAKLRDFLVDRGRVVDTLQGEISVICQDVKLLKEKFDERVPLSKSLSSSQTSCILASSSSSLKSMVPDQVPDPASMLDAPEKTDTLSYHEEHQTFGDVNSANTLDAPEKMDESSYREEHRAFGVVNPEIHNKDLLDDEWEICDNRELCV